MDEPAAEVVAAVSAQPRCKRCTMTFRTELPVPDVNGHLRLARHICPERGCKLPFWARRVLNRQSNETVIVVGLSHEAVHQESVATWLAANAAVMDGRMP